MKSSKPDYGFDGNPIAHIIILFAIAIVDIFIYLISGKQLILFEYILSFLFIFLLITRILVVYYVKIGKLQHRNAILSMVDWKGKENVLDIGTGRGLLMIGAAKYLTEGKSIGIDIWREQDMADNSRENTIENAKLEGVLNKIEIKNEDIRHTSFPNDYFDVILSNLCIHNISSIEGRKEACLEIIRILKPSGIALISDAFHTKEYYNVFESAGLVVEIAKLKHSPASRIIHVVKAVKKSVTI